MNDEIHPVIMFVLVMIVIAATAYGLSLEPIS